MIGHSPLRVVIIEDELPARAKLAAMLREMDPSIQIAAELGSVAETLQWLSVNPEPSLAFVDIQLSDDHSFEIFRRRPVSFPVVFTTAYDRYMMESFEFNSVDYLLKPITEEKLRRCLDKIRKLEIHFFQNNVLRLLQPQPPTAKDRLVARKGTEFVALSFEEVAYFFTEHKIVFVRDTQGRQMIIDKNLAELEAELDPAIFFRLNRKYIAHQKAIERFKPDNGKVQIFLTPEPRETVHVSKESAPAFRQWMGF